MIPFIPDKLEIFLAKVKDHGKGPQQGFIYRNVYKNEHTGRENKIRIAKELQEMTSITCKLHHGMC